MIAIDTPRPVASRWASWTSISDELVCNAAELAVSSAVLTVDGTGTDVPWTFDEEHERLTLSLPARLPAGTPV